MNNQQPHPTRTTQSNRSDPQRFVIWGERRDEPDWDTYIAALLAYALREATDGDTADGASHE